MTQTEHIDDKLLELAYGELPDTEARKAQEHVEACPRCAKALSEIRSVRQAMSQLPRVPAPAEGLESLLSYAQQQARSFEKRRPARWRVLFLSAAGAAACALLVVVSARVTREVNVTTFKNPQPARDVRTPSPPSAPLAMEVPAPAEKPASVSDAKAGSAAGGAESKLLKKLSSPPRRADPSVEDNSVDTEQHDGTPKAMRKVMGKAAGGSPEGAKQADAQRAGQAFLAGRQAEPAPKDKLEPQGVTQRESGPPPVAGAVSRVAVPSSIEAPSHESAALNEVASIHRSLNQGVKGPERAHLLNRLCELYYALGKEADGKRACDAVIREFPGSEFARIARDTEAREIAPRRETHGPSGPKH